MFIWHLSKSSVHILRGGAVCGTPRHHLSIRCSWVSYKPSRFNEMLSSNFTGLDVRHLDTARAAGRCSLCLLGLVRQEQHSLTGDNITILAEPERNILTSLCKN